MDSDILHRRRAYGSIFIGLTLLVASAVKFSLDLPQLASEDKVNANSENKRQKTRIFLLIQKKLLICCSRHRFYEVSEWGNPDEEHLDEEIQELHEFAGQR